MKRAEERSSLAGVARRDPSEARALPRQLEGRLSSSLGGVAVTFALLACSNDPDSGYTLQTTTCGEPGARRISSLGGNFSVQQFDGGLFIEQVGRRLVDPCGERTVELEEAEAAAQPLPGEMAAMVGHAVGPTAIWAVDADRVGQWDTDTGALSWIVEDVVPLAHVPGHGYVVSTMEAPFDVSLVSPDGGQRVLAANMTFSAPPPTWPPTLTPSAEPATQVLGSTLGILDEAGRLYVNDLSTPGREVNLVDVVGFSLTYDGQGYAVRLGADADAENNATLTRWDGLTVSFSEPQLHGLLFFMGGRFYPLSVSVPMSFARVDSVLDVDTGATIEIPPEMGNTLRMRPTADGKLVRGDDVEYWVWDPTTGQTTQLGGGVEIAAAPTQPAVIGDKAMITGSVLDLGEPVGVTVIPYDGSPAFAISDTATAFADVLDDGRVLFMDTGDGAPDSDTLPLSLAGPTADDDALTIDEAALVAGRPTQLPDGSIVYVVLDGDRSGLYRMELP